ncbi:uncharacterized protein [Bactrocera oleae]|uniref:uncharacterized protein n=1 Tax=Bactrocera oleae TaxID=104688 RepID=UPI00387E262F
MICTEDHLNKLQYIKLCALEYKEYLLMFVIKIPKEFQSEQLKTIIPIPNTAEIENVFEYKNVTYKFEEAKTLNELQISKHCIYLLNCELIKNSITEIFQIDGETILIKNANGIELNQNCDNRKIKLKNTTLIHYNNCTIKILYQTFSNTKTSYNQRFYYPNYDTHNFTNKITINDLVFKNEENLKKINELKYHKNISHIGISTLSFIVIIIIILISYKIKKKKNNTIQTQESFPLRCGGVMCPLSPQPDTTQQNIVNW